MHKKKGWVQGSSPPRTVIRSDGVPADHAERAIYTVESMKQEIKEKLSSTKQPTKKISQ